MQFCSRRSMYCQRASGILSTSRVAWIKGILAVAAVLTLGVPCHALQEGAPPQSDQLNLSDQNAVKMRGDLFMARKFFPEAVGMYKRLTELDPKNPLYQNLLGIAYHQLQDYK